MQHLSPQKSPPSPSGLKPARLKHPLSVLLKVNASASGPMLPTNPLHCFFTLHSHPRDCSLPHSLRGGSTVPVLDWSLLPMLVSSVQCSIR